MQLKNKNRLSPAEYIKQKRIGTYNRSIGHARVIENQFIAIPINIIRWARGYTALLHIKCGVGHCNGCVKFEFNDLKSLYTKKY